MSGDLKTALIAAVAAIIGGLIVAISNYLVARHESGIKMIEIAVGILSADPKDSPVKAARPWAVNVIDNYSSVPLDDDAKRALLDNPLPVARWGAIGARPTGAIGDPREGPIGDPRR